jgi:anthranilate synthase component 2
VILVIDNYDSFAYNLVQYVGRAVGDCYGGDPRERVVVRRNDAVDADGIEALDPDGVVVSPGPGTPEAAGVSMDVFGLDYPALGVCLGHQALVAANGGTVGHAPEVVHGKPSRVRHDGRGLFAGLPNPLEVGRYHSLCATGDLPDRLEATAHTVDGDGDGIDANAGRNARNGAGEAGAGSGGWDEPHEPHEPDAGDPVARPRADAGVVMAVRHRDRPHVGVQFHPESILTDAGEEMVRAFCERCSTT